MPRHAWQSFSDNTDDPAPWSSSDGRPEAPHTFSSKVGGSSSGIPTSWARSDESLPMDQAVPFDMTEGEDADVESTQARALPPSDISKSAPGIVSRRLRCFFILIFMALAALIGGAVVAVWATKKNSKSSGPQSGNGDENDTNANKTADSSPTAAPSVQFIGATLSPAIGSIPATTRAPSAVVTTAPSVKPTTSRVSLQPTTSHAPSLSPSVTLQPTSVPTLVPSTLFPTFDRVPTLTPTEADPLFESLHSVQWRSVTTHCNYGTPSITVSCGNGGQVVWDTDGSDNIADCSFAEVDRMVCDSTVGGGDGYLSFACRGTRRTQLPATVSIPGGSAIACAGILDADVFSVQYGGDARHYMFLQRFCGMSQDSVHAFDGYSCLLVEADSTDSGAHYCYSSDSCQATASCNPSYPNCGNATCSSTLTAVRVWDPDNRPECRFAVD